MLPGILCLHLFQTMKVSSLCDIVDIMVSIRVISSQDKMGKMIVLWSNLGAQLRAKLLYPSPRPSIGAKGSRAKQSFLLTLAMPFLPHRTDLSRSVLMVLLSAIRFNNWLPQSRLPQTTSSPNPSPSLLVEKKQSLFHSMADINLIHLNALVSVSSFSILSS
jgi:hypothetical protein